MEYLDLGLAVSVLASCGLTRIKRRSRSRDHPFELFKGVHRTLTAITLFVTAAGFVLLEGFLASKAVEAFSDSILAWDFPAALSAFYMWAVLGVGTLVTVLTALAALLAVQLHRTRIPAAYSTVLLVPVITGLWALW